MASAADLAYVEIRDMIVRGQLRSGEQLVADDLAAALGYSRTPIREAILRLTSEMFAERLDNKRTIVRAWSRDEVEDFVELRVRIAGYTAARAAQRITPAQIEELRELNDAIEALITQGEQGGEAFLAHNGRFHALIIQVAASERLSRISWQLINPAPLLRAIEDHSLARIVDTLADNKALVSALEAGDPIWAEAAMVMQVRRSYRGVIKTGG